MKKQNIQLEPADTRKYGVELKGAQRDGYAIIKRDVQNVVVDEEIDGLINGEIKYRGAIIPVESHDNGGLWEAVC